MITQSPLDSLSVSELKLLMQYTMHRCLEAQEPTPQFIAALGAVAAQIHFELWTREHRAVRGVGEHTH